MSHQLKSCKSLFFHQIQLLLPLQLVTSQVRIPLRCHVKIRQGQLDCSNPECVKTNQVTEGSYLVQTTAVVVSQYMAVMGCRWHLGLQVSAAMSSTACIAGADRVQ